MTSDLIRFIIGAIIIVPLIFLGVRDCQRCNARGGVMLQGMVGYACFPAEKK